MKRRPLRRRASHGRALGPHAWRILYRHRDYGYVIASSESEALRTAKASAPEHWTPADVRVRPDLRHPEVRAHYEGRRA